MPDGYESHSDYMSWVGPESEARAKEVHRALADAFRGYVEVREVPIIQFGEMPAKELAAAIQHHPQVLKALLASCNVAARALERDLDLRSIDTYNPRLSDQDASLLAGYLKPFLPRELALPALVELDRHFFVDKEIRARKGRWEKLILTSLNAHANVEFGKRKFRVNDESFELDAAAPRRGDIRYAVDVKRIEARRDIHKRADEVINKAVKLKRAHPDAKFAAVIYYPFPTEHPNVQSRLASDAIDAVCFATQSEEQLRVAIGLVVDKLGVAKRSGG